MLSTWFVVVPGAIADVDEPLPVKPPRMPYPPRLPSAAWNPRSSCAGGGDTGRGGGVPCRAVCDVSNGTCWDGVCCWDGACWEDRKSVV